MTVSDVVVKVNFSPYLLLVDLFDAVDDDNANATFEDGFLTLTLTKVTAAPWSVLALTLSKRELQERRAASLQRKEQKELDLAEKKKVKRIEDGRAALRQQVRALERG